MKKFKTSLALILALAMLLACAACGGTQESAQPSAEPTPKAVSPSPEAEGIVLTDQGGREVTLDAPAETVVSCYYISTYAMIALGAQERVVGLEKKADTRPIYSLSAPELLELPSVGTAKEFDLDYVLIHGTEGYKIADVLLEEGACVVAGPILCDRSKPELRELTPANPGMLSNCGVPVALCTDHPEIPIQYLPLCAGIAVKEGMDYHEALKAITISPAKKQIVSPKRQKRAPVGKFQPAARLNK